MPYDVTLIPGDGVGPEVVEAAVRVLEATGIAFRWDLKEAGEGAIEKHGTPLPKETLNSVRRNRVALKGPVTTPVGGGFRSVNVGLRQALDLYACLRPCKSYPGVRSRYQDVDLVVVRENTEDLYAGIEFEKGTEDAARLAAFLHDVGHPLLGQDTGISIKPLSVRASRRIVRFAFEYARAHGRSKVTAVHKANIMKFSDGLFLSTAREVAHGYPDVEFEDVLVDNLCMQLVRNPERYDVLVLPNLYGDIVSDLCAGLVGGLGVMPGANIGEQAAVFEPTHGSAPRYAGQNKVNPMAMILSAVMMLEHLGEKAAAQRLEMALAEVVAEGKTVTYDLKPSPEDPTAATTSDVAQAIIDRLKGP